MKKIAIDMSSFEEIIKKEYIYVDKTKYLYKIISNHKYYFLSRPRRFGKSLFINTLKAFFEGKRELFKELYIYDKEWNWEEYPIIKLDFNIIPVKNRDVLEKSMNKRLMEIANKYEVEIENEESYYQFSNLVKKLSSKYKKGVVILVDEYDKPIISHLGDGKEEVKIAKENMEFMKIFYDNLKPLESHIKTVFMTGVSKFSKVSIFSTLNNLIEIDKEPEYADIMGYTEEELTKYFTTYFEELSKKYEMSIEKIREKFKFTYNGFRFTESEKKVYNPFSSGRALSNRRFEHYWFESGTPTFLMKLIKEKNYDVINLEKIEIGRDKLKAYDIEKMDLIPLLFQTGYLTIKKIEDEIVYTLGYPNNEVESGFVLHLIYSFSEEQIDIPVIHKIKKSLLNKDINEFEKNIKSLFANISNINIPKGVSEREHFYNTIFYLTGVLFSDNNLQVYSELLTSEGRIDMAVETPNRIYIIEFKCNQSAEIAIKQIRDKNYKEKFLLKEKEILLLGVNFSTDKRNVEEIKMEK
ncbi:MAG: hypothetical protein B6I28_00910 [Fusobacteriia bacterium 4572_132]|nr:MAG: hypothetical protein B6I28_00910 [Fusobacteriia bacterium 4572_132]